MSAMEPSAPEGTAKGSQWSEASITSAPLAMSSTLPDREPQERPDKSARRKQDEVISTSKDDLHGLPPSKEPILRQPFMIGGKKPGISDIIRQLTPCSQEWYKAVPMNWQVNPAKNLEKLPSPKVQDARSPAMLLLGGVNISSLSEVLTGSLMLRYNIEERKWNSCNPMPILRYGHRCVYFNEEVYMIGGFDNRDATHGLRMSTSTCFVFNVREGEWRNAAPMNQSRGYHAVAVLEDRIYAVGGVDTTGFLSSVEWYSADDDTWTILEKELYKGRMGMAAAAFKGNLWVVGGIVQITPQHTCATAYVEIYNPKQKQWTYAASYLSTPRACATLLNVDDTELYCFGGIFYDPSNATRRLITCNDIAAYVDAHTAWKKVATMPEPRHNAHLLRFKDRTFLVGGQSMESPSKQLTSIVVDDGKFKWKSVGVVPLPISAYGIVIIPPSE
ncbi:alpha-scruin-like isoform X2 [Ornithodoros turicata]|uniref:alpha-scruin-like isoform X2 n=1 Tax=Ornithodoros turicata TaxID=34597 RepID=UPI00313A2F9B